jgi:hypothetical protein
MRPAFLITLAFAVLNVTVINPIGAHMNGRYKAMEMRYFERPENALSSAAKLGTKSAKESRMRVINCFITLVYKTLKHFYTII